jgi:hypothetical protein
MPRRATRLGWAVAVVLAAGLVARPAVARAQSEPAATPTPGEPPRDVLPPVRRGPLEVREEFLLAQPRLTLPSLSPDPLPAGQTRAAIGIDWGSDFGLRGSEPVLDHFVDGEHRTLALDVRRGITPRFSAGVRVPLHWRGPGVLDGLIDAWHGVTGLPDNDRGLYPRNQFRIEGRGADGPKLVIPDETGTGLGNLELMGLWAVRPRARGLALSLAARAELPTGTGPFDGAGSGFGLQVLAAHPLGRTVDVYAGVGGTLSTQLGASELEYSRARAHGFATLEWRAARVLSLLIETSLASRLVENIAGYPGRQMYFRMGAKLDLGARWRLEGGFVEGLSSIQTTTDFGVQATLAGRF